MFSYLPLGPWVNPESANEYEWHDFNGSKLKNNAMERLGVFHF